MTIALTATIIGLLAGDGARDGDSLGPVGPGTAVTWSAPIVGLVLVLAIIGCAGALLSVVFLLRIDGGPLGVQGRRAVRDAARAAIVWAMAALASAVVAAADVLGVPFSVLRNSVRAALDLPEVQSLLVSAVLAGLIAGTAGRIRTSRTTITAGGLAVAAMLPPLITAFPRNESGVVRPRSA